MSTGSKSGLRLADMMYQKKKLVPGIIGVSAK